MVAIYLLFTVAQSEPSSPQDHSPAMVPDFAVRFTPRRPDRVGKADEAALRGQRLLVAADWEAAVLEFRAALDLLPKAPIVQDRRDEYSMQFFGSNRKAGWFALRHGHIGKAWARVRVGWCDWLSFSYWKVRDDPVKSGTELLMGLRIPFLFGGAFLWGAVTGVLLRNTRGTAWRQLVPFGILLGGLVVTIVGASTGYFTVSDDFQSTVLGAMAFFLLMGVAIPVPYFAGKIAGTRAVRAARATGRS